MSQFIADTIAYTHSVAVRLIRAEMAQQLDHDYGIGATGGAILLTGRGGATLLTVGDVDYAQRTGGIEACTAFAAIAKRYFVDGLDETRPDWLETGVETGPVEDAVLIRSKTGKPLLTLGDTLAALAATLGQVTYEAGPASRYLLGCLLHSHDTAVLNGDIQKILTPREVRTREDDLRRLQRHLFWLEREHGFERPVSTLARNHAAAQSSDPVLDRAFAAAMASLQEQGTKTPGLRIDGDNGPNALLVTGEFDFAAVIKAAVDSVRASV